MMPPHAAEKRTESEEILIIEDNLDMIEILKKELTRHHYRVRAAPDGETGLFEAKRQPPALVILDLMLPGLSGWDICRLMKADPQTETIPLLILTALAEEADRIHGLESGADDYLSKPFSLRELMARVRALLRRKRMASDEKTDPLLRSGPLVIDTARHEIRMAGRLLRFTRIEFGILKHLAQHPDKVFKRDELISLLWGESRFIEARNLDVHIHSIRQQLEPDPANPCFLITVRGVGYKFHPPEEATG
ncbi:MAG: response regulator transcription factor [Nitrospirae bacterium]|nr:response regulator transcription factor [Candidatus Manganitrophaceae bacterium]